MTQTVDRPAGTPGAPGAAGGAAATDTPDPRRWKGLLVVLSATFMVLLDISIVNVAIPSIQESLGATFSQVQFVLAGYALAYAVFLITGGRLGDIFGRRRLFALGMAGFTAASALCGLAQSPVMLIAARVLQGLMAALMYPQTLSVIQVSFPPRERAAAFGSLGGVIGLATIMGPLLGGLIIGDNVGGNAWRFVFLVNVPVGITALALTPRFLGESRAPGATRLDLPGVAVLTVALGFLVYPLVEGRDNDWPLWGWAMLAASPLLVAAFALMERSVERRGGSPLVMLELFANRSFTVGLISSIVLFSAVPSFFFTFGLTLQIGLHFSALHAGLTTLPFAIGSALTAGLSVRLAPRLGKRVLYVGCALVVVGIASLVLVVHGRDTDLTGVELIPCLFVGGMGLGLIVAPILTIILAGVPGRDAGSASGVLTTVQQVGGALGVAVVGAIFFALISSGAGSAADAVAAPLATQLAAVPVPAVQQKGIVATFHDCFVRRASAKDPSADVPGCPSSTAVPRDPVGQAVAGAAQTALGKDFETALTLSLFYVIAAFALAGLLSTQLPRRAAGGPAAAVAGAH